MNPAALTVEVSDLKVGRQPSIVDTDAFNERKPQESRLCEESARG